MEGGAPMKSVQILHMALALAAAGCSSPRDDYDDFLGRTERGGDGGAEVVQSRLEDLSGKWLVHALLAGGLDLGLKMELAMDLQAMPRTVHAKIWLASANTAADKPLIVTDSKVEADGTFELHAEPLVIPAGSSPGLNVDVSANVVLHASTLSADAWCGGATGTVQKPLALDLAGSTFAARRDDG
jgi:hypothetical protein